MVLIFEVWVILWLLAPVILLVIGWFRKRGLWFLFGALIAIFGIFDLSSNGNSVVFLVGDCSLTTTCQQVVQLSSNVYFIPLIIIVVNLASIYSLILSAGKGAV